MHTMPDEQFWLLIETTLRGQVDPDSQIDALYECLDRLEPQDIEAFERAFQQQMRRSNTWDLRGAAIVIHGGESDDSFEYFQRWLIAQGQATFERALARPDDLATLIPDDAGEPCEFEDFGYVAMDIWTKKTGLDPVDDPASTFPRPSLSRPTGTPVKETEAHLAKRYPKLWQRFGDNPLG